MDINFEDYLTPINLFNGRINIMDDNKKVKTNIIKREPILTENNINSMSHSLEHSLLSRKFFSTNNINVIHKKIIIGVYENSNKKYSISKQNERELLIIMRSYYLQFGKNLDTNIQQQVDNLNKMVIDWSVEEIIKNIDQYVIYKQTASTLPIPMERSQLPSQKGLKSLEIKSFI
jgi:hypothetical protein